MKDARGKQTLRCACLDVELNPQTSRILRSTVANVVHHDVDLVGAGDEVLGELVGHSAGGLVSAGAGLGQGHGHAVHLDADHGVVRRNVRVEDVGRGVVVAQVEGRREGVVASVVRTRGRDGGLDPAAVGGEFGPQSHLVLHDGGLRGSSSVGHGPVRISGTSSNAQSSGPGSVC